MPTPGARARPARKPRTPQKKARLDAAATDRRRRFRKALALAESDQQTFARTIAHVSPEWLSRALAGAVTPSPTLVAQLDAFIAQWLPNGDEPPAPPTTTTKPVRKR